MTEQIILLIDDDSTLLELLADHLLMVGYHPLTAEDGSSGLREASENSPDLIILDVMMPGMDGWEVCRQIRERSQVPIILLTAKGQEIDKLRGFRLGVDDYVTKPFSFAELTARVGAILARTNQVKDTQASLISGNLVVDLENRRVTINDQVVELSPTEYKLLEQLARSPSKTVPTDQLLNNVWGSEYSGEVSHVKRYIWMLRKKLETDPGNPKHIITERGFGYRFE